MENLLVPITDLTGPLATCQSAEVAEKENHLWLFRPTITETVSGLIGINENLVGEGGNIEGHHLSLGDSVH